MAQIANVERAEQAEERTASRPASLNGVTERIIGAAIEVHRELGPGLMESVYEQCLCYELTRLRLKFQRQVSLPVSYKGVKLDCGFRMDLLVEDSVVLELKTVDRLLPVHTAQLLTYLKLSRLSVGLLLNFNEPVMRRGIKRVVNHFAETREETQNSASSAPNPEEEFGTPQTGIPQETQRLRVSAVNPPAPPPYKEPI